MRPQAPKYFGTGQSLSADNIYNISCFILLFLFYSMKLFFLLNFIRFFTSMKIYKYIYNIPEEREVQD